MSLGLKVRVYHLGPGPRVQGLGFRAEGSYLRVEGYSGVVS